MKTIKQLADEIGVSKTAVRKRLTNEIKTKFAETVCGVIHILPEGETLIKQSFRKAPPQTKFADVSANQFTHVSSDVSTLISMLQQELKTKNAEIERLHKVIDQEQQLRLAEIKKVLLPVPAKSEVTMPSMGFFARLFGKKNKPSLLS